MYHVLGYVTLALITGFILLELCHRASRYLAEPWPARDAYSIPVTEEEVVQQLTSRGPA